MKSVKPLKPLGTVLEWPEAVAVTEGGGEPATASPYGRPVADAWITGLSLLISLLALAATTAGIFTAPGAHHRAFLSLRGEMVTMQGGGLYANESVSGAAQAIGQDIVTLMLVIPLLLIAVYLASRGSLRGRLLRTGVLGYFTYTYLLMAFGAAYNPLFLVYVTLYSASLIAFLLSLFSIDAVHLSALISRHFARRTVAWLLISFGAMLALLWLGRILPALTTGAAPAGLESYSTLFVQAADLGLVVPLAILSGVFLLRRQPIGYLLGGVMLVQGATFGLALISMMITMAVSGTALVPMEAVFFGTLTLICVAGLAHLLISVPGSRMRQEAGRLR